jgi:phosphoglycerate dehydrogenase-like enzyme
MIDPTSDLPSVFIVDKGAERLRDLSIAALGPEVPMATARTRSEALDNYNGEPVVLGRPDYVAELMKTRPPVVWVQSTWAGVDPLLSIDNRDYRLTGVKEVFGPQMAEYVMAYLLAHEVRVLQRFGSQQQQSWDDSSSGSLQGKVFGVMGTGSIGSYVAKVAARMAMKPVGFNSSGRPVEPFERVYCGESLGEFLSQCDYLLAVLPDTPATANLLDAEAFAAMKPTTYLINAGRGNVLDEQALCKALAEKQLAGAVLDVFRQEPVRAGSPLWEAPNLLLTGHIAAVSNATDIARLFSENYRLFSSGQALRHVVDFARGY